jgi:hypothetical protein
MPMLDADPRLGVGEDGHWAIAEPGTFEAEAGHVAYWMVQDAVDRFPVAPAWMRSRLTPSEWRSHLTSIVVDIYGAERLRHIEDLRVRTMGEPDPMRRKASVLHMRESFEAAMSAIGGWL